MERAASDRPPRSFHLINGEERAKQRPETFHMEPLADRLSLKPGDFAKVGFEFDENHDGEMTGERMWVIVTRADATGGRIRYGGTLDNDPLVLVKELAVGQTVEFGPEHVLNWMTPSEMEAEAAARKAAGEAARRA